MRNFSRMEKLPVLLTTAEVAQRLGIHPATVRTWADKGWLPAVRLPNGYRKFREEDVTAAVDKILGTSTGSAA